MIKTLLELQLRRPGVEMLKITIAAIAVFFCMLTWANAASRYEIDKYLLPNEARVSEVDIYWIPNSTLYPTAVSPKELRKSFYDRVTITKEDDEGFPAVLVTCSPELCRK